MNNESEYIGSNIFGTWKLEKFMFKDHQNNETKFFGQAPTGILIYESSGYMSVQIAQENRPDFEDENFNGGSEQERAGAFSTFFSYYGRFKEVEPGKIVHTVEGSLFPNWLGQEEIRYAKISGNRLILSTPPIPSAEGNSTFEVTWKK